MSYPQNGDRIVTVELCDVISPRAYAGILLALRALRLAGKRAQADVSLSQLRAPRLTEAAAVTAAAAASELEVCGNRFFVPIPPPHFNDFIPIPIPLPFPSET